MGANLFLKNVPILNIALNLFFVGYGRMSSNDQKPGQPRMATATQLLTPADSERIPVHGAEGGDIQRPVVQPSSPPALFAVLPTTTTVDRVRRRRTPTWLDAAACWKHLGQQPTLPTALRTEERHFRQLPAELCTYPTACADGVL